MAHDVIGNIGNTPLLRLAKIARRISRHRNLRQGRVFQSRRLGQRPPGAQHDSRGERSGKLTHDKILIDATSGNTGIAYAMIGAARGYKVKLCLPTNASIERKRILKAYGAELVLTPADEGSDGAIRSVREIYDADPDRYFYPDQYNNDANWQAHFETTGPEIIEQTEGRITHFVALLGTSGTFIGNTRRLRKDLPHVKCISAQPSTGFHGIEGTKHMPTAIVPGIYDDKLADRNHLDRDRRLPQHGEAPGARRRHAGGHLGGRQRAWPPCTIAEELRAQGREGVIVTILCDSADKYLSEHFWDED